MKKLLFAAALVCAPLTMTACATTPDTRIAAGKADAAAWHALDGVAVTLKAMATSGEIRGQNATRARAMLDQATAALTAADAAYQSGNGSSAQQNVAVASALIAQLLTLIAQAKGA